jgi:hypothetical protein
MDKTCPAINHIRRSAMKKLFRFSVLSCQILGLLAFSQSLKAQPLQKATFELKNEITVQIPEGAK